MTSEMCWSSLILNIFRSRVLMSSKIPALMNASEIDLSVQSKVAARARYRVLPMTANPIIATSSFVMFMSMITHSGV